VNNVHFAQYRKYIFDDNCTPCTQYMQYMFDYNCTTSIVQKTCLKITYNIHSTDKKSLTIPKRSSESVYRRTNNTMAKRKRDKQRSTKHTYKTKDRVTQSPLKTGGVKGRDKRLKMCVGALNKGILRPY